VGRRHADEREIDPDLRFDLTQLGGPFYGSSANAQALVGSADVLDVALVVDGGWAGAQKILVDAVTLNGKRLEVKFGAAAKVTLKSRREVYDLPSNLANVDSDDDYSGVSFKPANGTTFASISHLGTDYKVQAGNCGGGAPRFSIGIDLNGDGVRDKSVFVYIGDATGFSCNAALQMWQTTGNVIGVPDLRYDLTQVGGTFYDTYANALALVGSKTVTGISLVVDAGWVFGSGVQDVLVDDFRVNNRVLKGAH
jgi:hypothetical protein